MLCPVNESSISDYAYDRLVALRAKDAVELRRGTAAAVYLLRADGAALLQLRDDDPSIPHPGAWVPPGGQCDHGEPLDVCARRELREETNVSVDHVTFLARFLDRNAVGFPPLDLAVFWALYDGVQDLICGEGQRVSFVPRADAERLGVPGYLVELWDSALEEARRVGAIPDLM